MSKASTSYRIFYPEDVAHPNPLVAFTLYDQDGAIVPHNVGATTFSENVGGWRYADTTLASAAEPLFVTPVVTNPGLGTPACFLTRDESGTFYQVLDETVFDGANPGRPTSAITAAQEHLLYETLSNAANGGSIWTVKVPVSPVSLISAKGKDPITGDLLSGNDILFRWTGKVPTLVEVEADVEDIADPRGFVPVELTNATTYAETSVGLSLVRSLDEIIPRDGMGHSVALRMRYNVNGDAGAWVPLAHEFFQYDMEAPKPCVSLTANLLRDRNDVISDLVELSWVKDSVAPGTGVEIFVTDFVGKKHSVYASDGAALSVRLENISRFIVQDEGPAVARPYRFHIVATNLSAKSSETYADPINITSKVKPVVPPTPDELAGTAREVVYAELKAEVFADVLTALGALPTEGQAIVASAVDNMLLKIKDVVAKGGSVALADFGSFEAKWTKERLGRNPSTGEPVITPAYRSLGFTPSAGFKLGTKNGTIMTDAQAKPAA
jgi:DNA-binding protein HU-beta